MRRLRGSIKRLSRDRWRVWATVHDEEGIARRVSKTVEGTRADAEAALDRLLERDGLHPDCRMSDAIDAWLAHCAARVADGTLAESTLEGYRQKVEHRIRPELGRTACRELSVAQLNRFIDSLESDKRGTFAVLRQVLNWSYRNGFLSDELARRMEPVPTPKPSVGPSDVYSAEECTAILNHPMPDALKTAVVLALSCGLRRGEICGLEWRDYDGERIEIRRAWGKDRPKTEASAAALTVPQWARDWLDPRRGEPSEKVVGLEPDRVTYGWKGVFLERRFKPYSANMRDDAPARYLPFKNLRHTNLTMIYESTGDIKLASRRGRHTTSAITERFYVRPSESVDRRAADALDGVFGGDFAVS